jgi:hypothetical protein
VDFCSDRNFVWIYYISKQNKDLCGAYFFSSCRNSIADDLLSTVIVLNADLRNNRRIPIYWYSDDPVIQKTLDTQYSNKFGIPLFTAEEKNNENMVGVINGEFACGEFASGNSTLYPGLNGRMPALCRASLPP